MATGQRAGAPEDVEQVLDTLQRQGLFERPGASPQAAWASPGEVQRSGTRLTGMVIAAWVLVVALGAGGYVGWQRWIEHRHQRAAELVGEAKAAAFKADYAALVDAERMLRLAREQHPKSQDVPRYELFVHMQRVLENGSRDLSALRAAVSRAGGRIADDPYLVAAQALLSALSGEEKQADAQLDKLLAGAAGQDGALWYLVGRIEHRLGRPQAREHLQAALDIDANLVGASLALAELHHEAAETDKAMALLDGVLARDKEHLRARLFKLYLNANKIDPGIGLGTLESVKGLTKGGAPTDAVLAALSRARLLLRQDKLKEAGDAVRDAITAGASEPRLLSLVAQEALSTGRLALAQRAASQAVAAAQGAGSYRLLLARVLLERRDGARALTVLESLPADDTRTTLMRARAALLSGDAKRMQEAQGQLDALPEPGPEAKALKLRLRLKLEPSEALLRTAKRLAQQSPKDPHAALAYGEAALMMREPRQATKALQRLTQLSPEDAHAFFMLGRAQRMAAKPDGAEASLRRALELSPAHTDAIVALGGLLLDTGKFEDADTLYQELVTRGGGTVHGRLGRVESLIGLGRLDEAKEQYEVVAKQHAEAPAVRQTGARLWLALGKPRRAIELLRPLTEGQGRSAAILALYGDVLYAANQVNVAAAAYEQALALDSGLPGALIGRAQIHLRAERPKDALALLEEARERLQERLRGPEVHARMLTLMGHAHLQRDRSGDLETARRHLERAVELPGVPSDAYFFLGESLGGKLTPEAAPAYQRYLELAPKGRYAARARRALGPLL